MHNYKNLHIWQEGINLARKIFLSIAIGSIFELHTQIAICEQIGYIKEETTKQLEQQIYTLQQQITTYKRRIEGSAPRQGETSPTSESKK